MIASMQASGQPRLSLASLLDRVPAAGAAPGAWLWLGYLAWLAGAELCVSLVSPAAGMVLHLGLLAALLAHASLGGERRRPLLLSLSLAPMIRILSLSLPLAAVPLIDWYLITSLPLMAAALIAAHQLGLTPHQMGLRPGNIPQQLALSLLGVPLGATEYLILRPKPLVPVLTVPAIVSAGLILMLATGFIEEFIFRGILQHTAGQVIGRWGILFVSLAFAALHIGYLSVPDVMFVFVVALIFSAVVARTGSLLGVVLAHGFTNIALYIAFPLLLTQSLSAGAQPAPRPSVATSPAAATVPALAPQPVLQLPDTRLFATLTNLGSGKLLMVGGLGLHGPVADAQIYDATSRSWSAAASMSVPRQLQAAVELGNGHVLVTGGFDATGSLLASAETYDPNANSWAAAAPMAQARARHSATLLPDGRVLVAGGNIAGGQGLTASAEVYDPGSGSWSATGPMLAPRSGHTAQLQPDGTVHVSGGTVIGANQDETYDPRTGQWRLG